MSMNDGSSRPRFMDTFKSALAPRAPIKIDPEAPNPIPRTVKIAGWLTFVAGSITAATGLLYIFNRHSSVQLALDEIATCKAQGVGVGTAVTSTDTGDFATLCKSLIDPTQDQVDSALSSLLMTGIIVLALGLITLGAGWGGVKGARWGRRLASGSGAVLLIGTVLGLFTHVLLLIAALLLVIGLALVYTGKGATYFIRAKAKGAK